MPIYNRGDAAQMNRTGVAARIDHGHILPRANMNSAHMARHGYDTICAHNLFAVYHIDKLSADNSTSFYNGKMCECTQISYEKM